MTTGRYQAYPEYKDSGVEWLGKVPERWDISPIKYLSDFVGTGGTPKENSSFSEVKEVYWFTPGDFNDNGILFESAKYLTDLSCNNGDSKFYKGGSVLVIGIGATLGKVGYCLEKFSCNQQVNVLTPNTKLIGLFMMYSLSIQSEQMRQLSNASTIGIMNQEKTKLIQIAVPSTGEQTQIANFLDYETVKIDTLIGKQQQLIKLLKEKRQAVISHAVTTGLNPDASTKDSGVEWLGDVPEHWKVKRFKNIFHIKKRIAGKLGYDILSITQKGIKIKDIESGEGQLSMDYSKYQLVHKGDFAMNHMDLLTGFVDISKYEGVTSPDYRVFTLVDKSSFQDYFLYFLQMGYINKLFFPFGQGAAHIGRWRLPREAFNEFLAPYPPETEQKEIATFIKASLGKMTELEERAIKAISLMQERRTALISAAVTGKIDVRNWQSPVQNQTKKEDTI